MLVQKSFYWTGEIYLSMILPAGVNDDYRMSPEKNQEYETGEETPRLLLATRNYEKNRRIKERSARELRDTTTTTTTM